MLAPLRSERRRTVLRLSLCSLAGTLLLAPLAAPPALPARAGGGGAATPLVQSAPDATPEPRIAIARDPFVPDAAVASSEAGRVDGAEGVVVEAIALGESPRALVAIGSASRIVRVGDALEDSTVSTIDERGIHLESGEALPLAAPK